MSRLSVLVLPLALAATGRAHADPAADRLQATIEVSAYREAVDNARHLKLWTGFDDPESACRAAVARGNAAGVPAGEKVDAGRTQFAWKDAPAVCAEYGRYHALDGAMTVARDALRTYFLESRPEPNGARTAGSADEAAACVARLDAAIAAGAPKDAELDLGYRGEALVRGTIVQARALCAEYEAWSKQTSVELANAAAAAAKALRDRYAQHGIGGDRLAYLIANGHRPIRGKRCTELDMGGLKSSPVFYELGQDDLAWIVYKTEFKKDKKVRESTRRYSKRGQWACK